MIVENPRMISIMGIAKERISGRESNIFMVNSIPFRPLYVDGSAAIAVTNAKPVIPARTTVSQNVAVALIIAWFSGLPCSMADAVMPAEPIPASFENRLRETPYRMAFPTL